MPTATISTTQALHTLNQLHAELGGKIQQNKEEAERLAQDMRHVEAVMKLLDPSHVVRGISVRRRRPNPFFKRGTIFRSVLGVLREAEGPLTASEITDKLLVRAGVAAASREDFRNLFSGVTASLRNHAGKTVRNVADGIPAKWEVIR